MHHRYVYIYIYMYILCVYILISLRSKSRAVRRLLIYWSTQYYARGWQPTRVALWVARVDCDDTVRFSTKLRTVMLTICAARFEGHDEYIYIYIYTYIYIYIYTYIYAYPCLALSARGTRVRRRCWQIGSAFRKCMVSIGDAGKQRATVVYIRKSRCPQIGSVGDAGKQQCERMRARAGSRRSQVSW